ncbi:hypothetical protein G3I24_16705, partial [Micromonospora aurantiaca]|nr:hypothetical protein [Micromonospora aurantiaca]
MALLPLLSWPGIDLPDQHQLLDAHALHVGVDAAAVAIDADSAGQGIELLEQARSVMWSQLLDRRA